jgi:anaerobic magnesium-protoporphyrin IX monomethyl ester cyclase
VLLCPDIDICVRGEGERTIVELLHAIESNGRLDKIRGITYKERLKVVGTPPREFIDDLDSLCFPHEAAPHVLKDYDRYPPTAFKHIFAVRGCPYNCFYCGSRNIWGRKVRFRSPANVVKEINNLRNRGLKSVNFEDDTFGVSRGYIRDLCSALMVDCEGLRWSCELPVKLVNEEVISLMKAAGCNSIHMGIESGNDRILEAMRKGITVEEAIRACRIIKKHGIDLQLFFMVGFPQETEDTLADTVRLMKKITCDYLVYSIFTPYPGTESFEFCKENGLIGNDYDVSLYDHRSPANCFCVNMSPERFRVPASEAERMVERKNRLEVIKRMLSLETLRRIRYFDAVASLRIGTKILVREQSPEERSK